MITQVFLRRLFPLGIGIALTLTVFCVLAALDPAALREQLAARFGTSRIPLLNEWMAVIDNARPRSEETRLRQINDFINRRIVFEEDISVWAQSDYWATPLETIGQGRGDCEDFSIIKYVSLRQAGIPASKLRLVYVKARLNTEIGPVQVAHMVLAYYATPKAEPLVLDNLNPSIQAASRRGDLQPIFSFNSEGIFPGVSGKDAASRGGIGRLSRWENALRRIQAEGFD